ncbi:hypothetical protein [Sellimonas intestinalis]|uniref:hypothetical protein n=1 Tax=Sellimonas intestinalis TaxID=1653434 RepID=UPI0039A1A8E9
MKRKWIKTGVLLLAAGYFLVCSSVLSGKAAEAAGSTDKKRRRIYDRDYYERWKRESIYYVSGGSDC